MRENSEGTAEGTMKGTQRRSQAEDMEMGTVFIKEQGQGPEAKGEKGPIAALQLEGPFPPDPTTTTAESLRLFWGCLAWKRGSFNGDLASPVPQRAGFTLTAGSTPSVTLHCLGSPLSVLLGHCASA